MELFAESCGAIGCCPAGASVLARVVANSLKAHTYWSSGIRTQQRTQSEISMTIATLQVALRWSPGAREALARQYRKRWRALAPPSPSIIASALVKPMGWSTVSQRITDAP